MRRHGVCVEKPVSCAPAGIGVCACDDTYYVNECLLQQAGKSKKNDGPCLTTSAMLCPADPSQSSAVGESKDGCGFLVAAQAFDQILLLVG